MVNLNVEDADVGSLMEEVMVTESKEVSAIAKAMTEINEVIKVNKLNARDVAHIATELTMNANLALVLSTIYSNGLGGNSNGQKEEEVLGEKDKAKGRVPVKNVKIKSP